MIRLALGRYRGHLTEVAKRLGIGRSTLYRKMREFGLEERPRQLATKSLASRGFPGLPRAARPDIAA